MLTWSLRREGVNGPLYAEWADLRHLVKPPSDLLGKAQKALELFPCDLLFVHRDAENVSCEARREEITASLRPLAENGNLPPYVRVVPVRMVEAWLLHDEAAIRKAADNPRGRHELSLPKLRDTEQIADPKLLLHEILREATGLNTRRRRAAPIGRMVHRIGELTEDFNVLDALPAFARFRQELAVVLERNPAFR
jgi:hypothetical protein